MIHNLASKNEWELGGFRIEVSVRAVSLRAAYSLVAATPFLYPSFWLGVGELRHPEVPPSLLSFKVVTRAGVLANANYIYQMAEQSHVFSGAASMDRTATHVQVLTDVLNAIGWNNGLRTSTKALDQDAWWLSTADPGPMTAYDTLDAANQTDEQIRHLFILAREACGTPEERWGLPCSAHPDHRGYRFHVNSKEPFSIRCSDDTCRVRLARAAIVRWIADLVQAGVIDPRHVGIAPV